MRLYVACSSKHLREARGAMNRLRRDGHEIVGDWIDHYLDQDISLGQAASFCREGINEAEAVVFLEHEEASRGAWYEFGYASGTSKPIFVLAGFQFPEDHIFLFSDNVTHAWTWSELLEFLREREGRPICEDVDEIPF